MADRDLQRLLQAPLGMDLAPVERTDAAGRVACRGLDLDDVRPEVGQNLAAEQAALVGQVEDAVGGEYGWSPEKG